MQSALRVLRKAFRCWPVPYWAFFAWRVLDGARYPGFMRHPELVPYPWAEVGAQVLLMAIVTAWLAQLVRGGIPRGPFTRWGERLTFFAITLSMMAAGMWTDQPMNTYALATFATASFVISLVSCVRRPPLQD